MGGVESCCREKKDDALLVTKMDLSHCGCVEVPSVVFNAERCIETLILSSNQITSLPPQLFHCQELKHLNLIDNCISSIPPAIGSLMHLVSLKLDKNNLQDLPDNLKCCRKLKRLSLNNNQWKQVPNIATQLISLEEMYMNDCELGFLPASVGRLTKLKILELRNNNLCNLPLSMSRLTSLSRLDIGDNEFTEFPACINSLKSLTELLIDNNDIEEITDIKNLVNLEHFDASYNHITCISETIGCCTNLSMLNLSFNYLEQLPESIGNIEKLETLHLEMNELSEIPKTIGRLRNLEDLNICNNRLCNIPISIGLLRNLRNLNLSRNTIEEFPPEIGSCTRLAIINAGYNRLQILPSEIGYLNNLKVLDLVGNFLMYLPITIINLRSVRAIWLSANQNVPLIPFTEDLNIASGERFLTNIALPQLGEIPLHNNQNAETSKVTVNEKSSSWSKKIRFAEDEDLLPGKLHRTPTPFPKELRAPNRKQHARSDELKGNDNYVNVYDGKACVEQELHPPAVPITKNGSGLLNFTESCITMIREANIRRNNRDSNLDTDLHESYSRNNMSGNEAQYLQESNVDYVPADSVAANTESGHGDARLRRNSDEAQVDRSRGVQKGEERVEDGSLHASDVAHRRQQSEDARRQALPEPAERSQADEPARFNEVVKIRDKNIYSNVADNAIEIGRSRQNTPVQFEYSKVDAQTIREMYHNDLITGRDVSVGNKANDESLRRVVRNGAFESTAPTRPKDLNLPCANYGEMRKTRCDGQTHSSNVVPQKCLRRPSDAEKPLSKQDMINLTEKMRSQNLSPPCYEIAKMYSTKAALFEQNRLENCS